MGTILCPHCHQLVSDESDLCALCGASIVDAKTKTSLFLERTHQLVGKPLPWSVTVNGTPIGTLDDGGAFLMVEDGAFAVEIRIDRTTAASVPPEWTDRLSMRVTPPQHRHIMVSQTRHGLVARDA